MILASAIGAMSMAAVIGYTVGHHRGQGLLPVVLYDFEGRADRSERDERLAAELRQEVVQLRQREKINGLAVEELRRLLRSGREQVAELKEKLSFYRSLMAPSAAGQGLDIYSLALSPAAAQRSYRFELVIRQLAAGHRLLEGSATLAISGKLHGEDAVLKHADLIADGDGTEPTFSFRYFTRVVGNIRLPEYFEPATVEVVVQTRGRRRLRSEQQFDWRELGLDTAPAMAAARVPGDAWGHSVRDSD